MENEQKVYTIKEVSRNLKIPVGKLREWERLFPNVLYVQRTKTGARLYTEYDLEMLRKLKLLKDHNISDEGVTFIIGSNHDLELEEEVVPGEYDHLLSLQYNTLETIEQLRDSFAQVKAEMIQEVKDEVKNEIIVGHQKTKSLIQSYSHTIVEIAEHTKEEVQLLRQDIYVEEEEKLFIQQKLEERETQFQEFVHSYREAAAANQKQRFPNLLNLLKWKKANPVDLS
ncbi:MerR family transcriptional regulator [bacterium LRH843]|nr:MerR family transcriptional regulator [bacterium LRH843]